MFGQLMQPGQYEEIHFGQLLGITDRQFEVLALAVSLLLTTIWLWLGYRRKRKR
jgi:hypothetical protein